MIYVGKTKDVYPTNDPNVVLLKFKDDVTGKDGQFDPGENQVGLAIGGMGMYNLLVSKFFCEQIEAMDDTLFKKTEHVTHYLSADTDAGTMNVRNATLYGQGLEVIVRFRATGSFIRRFGMYAAEGDILDPCTVEFTLKDDERGDPLANLSILEVLGILQPAKPGHPLSEHDVLSRWVRKIATHIRDILAERGMELYDIKLEFGRDYAGEVMLIDEVSAGSMRVYKDGVHIDDPMELSKLILGDNK